MKPSSLAVQFLGACGAGIFIGRMSVSLPLELRLNGDNAPVATADLAAVYATSLSAPPLVLLELAVRQAPLRL